MTENREAFLKELTELTKKHGITIGGCGCCGSPFLYKLEPEVAAGHYTTHGSGDDDLQWETEQ